MKVGLFFGSFNPLHIGHLIVAQAALNKTDLDKVWFVISPQNPFKKKSSLAHEFDRYDMVKSAVENNPQFDLSDIAFHLSTPSYTAITLTHLADKFKSYEFSLLIGEDNLTHFHKWKNCEEILKYHRLLVYPRPDSSKEIHIEEKFFQRIDAPMVDISASYIRNLIKEKAPIRYLVPEGVEKIILERSLYE